MAATQSPIKANIKFVDLPKVNQETLQKYLPVVEKLFFIQSNSGDGKETIADQEYRADVAKFLKTVEAIFGDKPPDNSLTKYLTNEKDIHELCSTSSQLLYRKQFRVYSYLTMEKLENIHSLAENDATLKIEQHASNSKISATERADLKQAILLDLRIERLWIDEVNTFKKNCVLGEIKTEIIQSLRQQAHTELPNLFENTKQNFYDEQTLFRTMKNLMKASLETFQEQIPFKEDSTSVAKIFEDFQNEVELILKDFVIQNESNKCKSEQSIVSEFERRVAAYGEEISRILKDRPMARPEYFRIQHKISQEINWKIPKNPSILKVEFTSNYQQKFIETTDKMFHQLVLEQGKQNVKTVNSCHREVSKVVDEFTKEKITEILKTHQIPDNYINEIGRRFQQQINILFNGIKESTIANPVMGGSLLSTDKQVTESGVINRGFGTNVQKKSCMRFGTSVITETMLRVNVRLLNGQTYAFDVHKMCTVAQLKDALARLLKRSDSLFTMCHQTKKLQDANTLESYNIKHGDFIMANI